MANRKDKSSTGFVSIILHIYNITYRIKVNIINITI